ncbi:MAG TPA: GTP-binding protein [Candidatus Nesterenkonia stercoripullorum]|uniref:GTP-binding protein n=1 Tax=Candidatus Nesterenkonia stercoripullorum TaxID=2838701 RepID=A0A9D1S0F7_9MICC|nr:GTP-binding protein [Candidatus Nesterenkonia stercoripullorum]
MGEVPQEDAPQGNASQGSPRDAKLPVIAVMGSCAPHRQGYARRLAATYGMVLVSAGWLRSEPDGLDRALDLMSRVPGAAGCVVELPSETPVQRLIGELASDEASTSLMDLVCVVDAAHLISELCEEQHVQVPPLAYADDDGPLYASAASLAVAAMEFASTIAVADGHLLDPDDLSAACALLSHLSPLAEIRCADECFGSAAQGSHEALGDKGAAGRLIPRPPLSTEHTGAGWICVLNGAFEPAGTHPRVSVARYEQLRPFHPGRLADVIENRLLAGEFGVCLRSVGFLQLASRAEVTAQWEHIGKHHLLHPVTVEEEPLAFGQDIAFIGMDWDADALFAALDEAALTDQELLAGSRAWESLPDPFPEWSVSGA